MKKTKIICAVILAATCILSAAGTAAFAYTRDYNPEDEMIKCMFSEEKAGEIVSGKSRFTRTYIFTDGTTCESGSGTNNRIFRSES
ncbi:MAG: hypothetical protein ACI4I9_10315 [Porcipelethomonas sp.]